MKGSKQVIDVLNGALAGEIVAINQYLMHAKMLQNWGYLALSDHLRTESLDQMKHAETLMERILFLEGVPALQMVAQPTIGQTVPEMFQNDLALELLAVKRLNDGVTVTRAQGDNASADLLARILGDEEEHVNWIQTQQGLIQKLGESTYLLGQLRA